MSRCASSSKSRGTNTPILWAALSLIAALPPDEVVELLRGRASRLGEQIADLRRHINDALGNDLRPTAEGTGQRVAGLVQRCLVLVVFACLAALGHQAWRRA